MLLTLYKRIHAYSSICAPYEKKVLSIGASFIYNYSGMHASIFDHGSLYEYNIEGFHNRPYTCMVQWVEYMEPWARFINKVKSIIMRLDFSSSQLYIARISLNEIFSKLILTFSLTLFAHVNRVLQPRMLSIQRIYKVYMYSGRGAGRPILMFGDGHYVAGTIYRYFLNRDIWMRNAMNKQKNVMSH